MRAIHQIIGLSSLAVVLLLIGKPPGATTAETLSAIKPEGTTELAYKAPGGNIIRVEISQAKIESSFPYKDELLWGGDVGELPETVLTLIQVSQNKKPVFVRLSAYSDLGTLSSPLSNRLKRGSLCTSTVGTQRLHMTHH
jgi:hypothetical protein